MDWLKQLLTGIDEDKQNEIVEAFKQEFPKHAVPKEQYSKKTNELQDALTQLDETNKKIEELGNNKVTAEEYEAKIKEITEQHEQYKADVEKREVSRSKTSALSKALEEAGAVKSSIDLLVTTFDLDAIQVDKKGNIVDLDDVLNPVKEQRKELFVTKSVEGQKPPTSTKQTDYSELSDQEAFNLMMKKG